MATQAVKMGADLYTVKVAALRLERYSRKVKDKIWIGDRRKLIDALADVAEAAEIARRLYNALEKVINALIDEQPPRIHYHR